MKKFLVFAALMFGCTLLSSAQGVKENFDSNSLDWTETPKGIWGSTMIDKGVMMITSKERGGLTQAMETHCYAPLNVKMPFTITSNVVIGKLDDDHNQRVGIIFNYMDFGNYYCFCLNQSNVWFLRVRDNELVGQISQGVKWPKKTKAAQLWKIEYDGNQLSFIIDGMPMIKVKYVEMNYAGFGFYAEGNQSFVIDDVEFLQ